MNLNELNLILVERGQGRLFLQTTVYVPRIDYRAADFKVKRSNKKGTTTVEVYIKKDTTLPRIKEFVCLNPIVHAIDLGNSYTVEKGKIDNTIKVTLYELIPNPTNRSGKDDKKKVDSKETDTTTASGETP